MRGVLPTASRAESRTPSQWCRVLAEDLPPDMSLGGVSDGAWRGSLSAASEDNRETARDFVCGESAVYEAGMFDLVTVQLVAYGATG